MFPVITRLTEKEHNIKSPFYIFDNSPAHTFAADAYVGMKGSARRALHPANSPDMNKMAEHAVAYLKKEFFKRLLREGANQLTARKAQDWLVELAEGITPEMVMEDAVSLVDTMRVIRAAKGRQLSTRKAGKVHGSAGDWPPAELR